MAQKETWHTIKQLAPIARLHEKTLYRAVRRGKLRKARNGVRGIRIAWSEFQRWMNGGGALGA